MKQEERRQQTIRQLLHSTKELIREKGCHSVTMNDIMDKSGLSKGAIFHYVKSKDEIFAWILQEQVKGTNERFLNEIARGNTTFEGPMKTIAEGLHALEDAQDETNKVLVYLIGREDQPEVAAALRQFHELSVQMSKQWIMSGQRHGVIRETIDAEKTAEMFVLLSLGLRVRSSFPTVSTSFHANEYASFIASILKSD
ncbi:MAG: TetR family transcriptional regulator [Paenibacillus sp.]|nr:TetR family transcriptional regulator [Paenibacillus sp.]